MKRVVSNRIGLSKAHRYSLISRSGNIYEINHRLIHTYAREQLSPAIEIVVRLATYHTAFVKNHPGKFDQLNRIRPHVIALLHSCGERQASEGAWLANLGIACRNLGQLEQAQQHWQASLRKLSRRMLIGYANGFPLYKAGELSNSFALTAYFVKSI